MLLDTRLFEKLKNYDYTKQLEYSYFKFFDEIYDYDPKTKLFKITDVSRYLFYSKMLIIKTCNLTSKEIHKQQASVLKRS